MEEIIFLVCVLFIIIIYIFLSSFLLKWVANKILINGLDFKRSLKIILILSVAGLFLVVIKFEWIIIFVSFFLFHYLIQYFQKEKIKFLQSLKIYIIHGLIGLVLGIVIVFPVRAFVFQPFEVKGKSMNPTLNEGDYLIVKEFGRNFKRGDIVIVRNPLSKGEYFIERIIGLPDEEVVIKNGNVYIDNNLLNEDYIGSETAGDVSFSLSSRQYYVMGDNRLASLDSRKFGPVPYKHIVGKIFFKSDLIKKYLKYYGN